MVASAGYGGVQVTDSEVSQENPLKKWQDHMMQRLMTLPKRGNMSHVLPSVVELISSKDPPEAAVFMSESNTGTQSMTQSHTARRTATNSAG